MELEAIHKVFFVGIGGIGMSALARYFSNRGCVVSGYDRTKTQLTSDLEREEITITYTDDDNTIPAAFSVNGDDVLVVYTPAIPKNAAILNFFKQKGFTMKKRSEVLGIVSKGQFCIAVAGTHGKTTTSTIIAHVLTHSGYGCTAFLGGISSNYNSNFLIGDNNTVVIEADEYDRSFLTLHPDIAVITSMDADHLDIYGDATQLQDTFREFAQQLKPNGTLFVKSGLPITSPNSYGITDEGRAHAGNIRVADGAFMFDFRDSQHELKDLRMMLPGKHNVENAVAAIAVALQLGIAPEKIEEAISAFKGVKRRFEYIVRSESHVYIDDYAHHPEELRACFDAVRQLYPEKRLSVIFQPHLFTRTIDFARDFAEVLSTVDDLMLLEIYPARELPIEGVNSAMLLDQIELKDKLVVQKADVVDLIKTKRPELLVTVGAGDIDTLIQPLQQVLKNA